MRIKLALLGIIQFIMLAMGVSFIASVTPSHAGQGIWINIGFGAIGVIALLLALQARDVIRELTKKP